MNSSIGTSDIRSFYNEFFESRMLDYRIHGNPRIDRAARRVLEFVNPDSHVLDIGCGIGIVCERVADHLESGHVWGVDISDRNIWYARETVDHKNASFFTADITNNSDQIRSKVDTPLDVISLIDVIEHIPKEEHSNVFRLLRTLVEGQAFVVMAYPSPQYQRYLMSENPEEMQIIDQVIEREELLRVAKTNGFSLRHYSLEDGGKRNQYVHCVLQMDSSLSPPSSTSPGSDSLFQRFVQGIKVRMEHRWDRYVQVPYRRWKYIYRVFDRSNGDE